MLSKDTILQRADDLLATASAASLKPNPANEAYMGALNLLRVVHGPGSVQEGQLIQAMKVADGRKDGTRGVNLHDFVVPAVTGALKSLKAEVEAGLTGNIMLRASGEVLGDLLSLAKVAMADGGDDQKNVAAVLVAAAFEDTIRRLAEVKAGLTNRPNLQEVVGVLKTKDVLVGASVATAVGYLKFRNDALHADWQSVQAPTVMSCMAFVEGLLLQHFA